MLKASLNISTAVDREKSVTLETRSAIRARVHDRHAHSCHAAVIWIDWYAYHVARFEALLGHPQLSGRVMGIQLVDGAGVHPGLRFRETIPEWMPVETLFKDADWDETKSWKLAIAVWRCLNRIHPSTVFVPGYYTVPALAAAIWARCRRIKTVLMTESTARDHRRLGWREALKTLLVRGLFDWAIAGGGPHKDYLQALGFPPSRIASFYDVVDNDYFRDNCEKIRGLHRRDDFSLPCNYFLYVGRLAPEKNTTGLITAYANYRKAGGTWSLVLAGDGPQLEETRLMSLDTPYASDIHFLGLLTTVALIPCYTFASAFVLPSLREPWGLVVNEAMASSLPVVVSRRSGCVEDLVREGENGFTFDPAEPGALTEVLLKLGALNIEERGAMAQKSYERISRYSRDAWADEVARIVRAER